MNSVREVNGSWFVYTDERVLGPFRYERQAIRATKQNEEETRYRRCSYIKEK